MWPNGVGVAAHGARQVGAQAVDSEYPTAIRVISSGIEWEMPWECAISGDHVDFEQWRQTSGKLHKQWRRNVSTPQSEPSALLFRGVEQISLSLCSGIPVPESLTDTSTFNSNV